MKPEALRAKVLADLAARSDAAGIIATAFALNGMLWQGWDSLNTQYELLLEFIGDHPDAMTIRRALD